MKKYSFAFSLFVILFLLSWLIPIMAVLIKLESKGPVFFKQSRPGFDEKEFMCFKFRSMRINDSTEKEATRNDPRVTKIGKFIRKTTRLEFTERRRPNASIIQNISLTNCLFFSNKLSRRLFFVLFFFT